MGGRCCGEVQELESRHRGPIPPGVTRPDDMDIPTTVRVTCPQARRSLQGNHSPPSVLISAGRGARMGR